MTTPSIRTLVGRLLVSFVPLVVVAGPGVTISNDSMEVILDSRGAQLHSIRHTPTDTQYLWQGDPAYWAQRSPNMFPVCVRFRENHYTYQGNPYEMPFLGLAHTADFTTEEQAGPRVVQTFQSSPETMVHYPFPFEFRVISELTDLTLIQRYEIINQGGHLMYFALGGHPGFNTPLNGGRVRDDYELVFSQKLTTDRPWIKEGLVQTHRVAFLDEEDRLPLGDARVPPSGLFLQDHPSRQIGIALAGRDPYVTVDLQDFPNTNLWTPPDMPYACIEPMVGHHDLQDSPEAIEDKPFLIVLPAGQTATYQYTITVDPQEGVRALGLNPAPFADDIDRSEPAEGLE